MNDQIDVKVDTQNVGVLFKEDEIYEYVYQNEQNFISLTMPIRKRAYKSKQIHPIFEMHLPEGYLLSIIKKHFSKLTKIDHFNLLKIMSNSIHGRITYGYKNKQENILTLNMVLNSKDENLFSELVKKFALNSAISGVQPKVLAQMQNKATLQTQDFIVKSWGEDYPELALNEYLCMSVAKKANIPTPLFYLSNNRKLFIMERFDVKKNGKYLGFEDMCVLQGKNTDEKYEGSYEHIAKTIKTFVSPQNKKLSLINFFKIIVINYLLKNGDGHLKNFALLYDNIKNITLAPAYDIVTTTAYIKNDIPALFLMGSKKWWGKEYLLRFGEEVCDLTKKEVNDVYECCIKAKNEILETFEKYENNNTKNFLNILKQQWIID